MNLVYPRKPTTLQTRILQATERFLVLVAGRRFGKTVLAVLWLLLCVLAAPPGALGYYVCPFRNQAKSIAWEELKTATKGLQSRVPNETELTVTLIGNRRLSLKGADDPESLEGVGLTAVVLDEFARMKLSAWERSLRPALSDKKGRALFIGKPRGFNHLKTFFDKGYGVTKQPEWRSWQFKTIDGGFVSKEDIEEARNSLPPRIFRQEYEASFETLAGKVYEEFSDKLYPSGHILTRDNTPRHFSQVVAGVDWGFTNPFAIEVIGESNGRAVACFEQYGKEFNQDKLKADFQNVLSLYPECEFYADPSRPDLIKEFSSKLGITINKAKNNVDEGILEVMKALHPKENLGPSLLVSEDCQQLITSMSGYCWETDREGNPKDKPQKVNDHAPDSLRYGMMGLKQNASVGNI